MELSDELLGLLRRPSTCYIATAMGDGSPQLTQTGVDTDGEHVIVNSVQGFVKVRKSSGSRARPSPSPTRTTLGATSRCST